jgi:hypothetical protein
MVLCTTSSPRHFSRIGGTEKDRIVESVAGGLAELRSSVPPHSNVALSLSPRKARTARTHVRNVPPCAKGV